MPTEAAQANAAHNVVLLNATQRCVYPCRGRWRWPDEWRTQSSFRFRVRERRRLARSAIRDQPRTRLCNPCRRVRMRLNWTRWDPCAPCDKDPLSSMHVNSVLLVDRLMFARSLLEYWSLELACQSDVHIILPSWEHGHNYCPELLSQRFLSRTDSCVWLPPRILHP